MELEVIDVLDKISELIPSAIFRDCKVEIDYVNWKQQRRVRKIKPLAIRYGSTEWHPEEQLLLIACDLESDGLPVKAFAMRGILSWHVLSDAKI